MHVVTTVRLDNGRQFTERVEKLTGWIGLPLTREQRLKKFYSCARRVLKPDAADRIVEIVENIEQKQYVTDLMTLVRA